MTGGWEGDVLGLFLGRQKRRAFDQDASCKCIKIIEQAQKYYRKQELDQKKAVSNRMETVVLTASATVTTREENHLPVNRTNSLAWWRLHGLAGCVTSPPGSKLKR